MHPALLFVGTALVVAVMAALFRTIVTVGMSGIG